MSFTRCPWARGLCLALAVALTAAAPSRAAEVDKYLPDDTAIVNSVIGLGKNLRCRIIAEGVEREDQAAWLRASDCKLAAGFWFARPISAGEFGERLASRV